jgi:hypothetical protein
MPRAIPSILPTLVIGDDAKLLAQISTILVLLVPIEI